MSLTRNNSPLLLLRAYEPFQFPVPVRAHPGSVGCDAEKALGPPCSTIESAVEMETLLSNVEFYLTG